MKQVHLYYAGCHLGVLTFEDGKFVYNSDLEGEKLYEKVCPLKYEYKLRNSVNRASELGFMMFDEYVRFADREDAKQLAGIEDKDDTFTRLYKVAALLTNEEGYYIRQK